MSLPLILLCSLVLHVFSCHYEFVRMCHLSYTCHMPSPSHCSGFHSSNTVWWRVHMSLLCDLETKYIKENSAFGLVQWNVLRYSNADYCVKGLTCNSLPVFCLAYLEHTAVLFSLVVLTSWALPAWYCYW